MIEKADPSLRAGEIGVLDAPFVQNDTKSLHALCELCSPLLRIHKGSGLDKTMMERLLESGCVA